jgi:hypothetical protein
MKFKLSKILKLKAVAVAETIAIEIGRAHV